MGGGAFHEDLGREEEVLGPSDRSFGLTFAGFFALLAGVSILRGGDLATWFGGLAAGFLVIALGVPSILRPLNWIWLRIGLLLHRVVNPIVMGVIFFAVVTPLGIMMRAFRAGGFEGEVEPERSTYWIDRSQEEPPAVTMPRQF